ncbi:MAG: hypothetical protein J3K34DRAFT_527335 [Monoraphidium minutum]|nr:MAG: hypothetical protein J3K34DRAFT_527335 [Monoraphidium minutum]
MACALSFEAGLAGMATLWPAQRARLAVRAQATASGGPGGRRRRSSAVRGPLIEVEGFQRRLTTSIHHAPSLAALRDVLVAYQGCLNPVHTNALMVRTAALVTGSRLAPRDMLLLPGLLPALRDLVIAQLPHYSERCVANTLHSVAALDMRDRELLAGLMDAAAARAPEMTPQGLANVAWALARLRAPPPPRLAAALLAGSGGAMRSFSGQELADVGWAAVTLRLAPPPGWGDAWLAAAQARLERADDVAASRLLWAAARLGLAPSDEWRGVAWRAVSRALPAAGAHSAALLLWSATALWAPAGGLPPRQRSALLRRVVASLPAAGPADVAVVLQALAAGGGGGAPDDAIAAALLARTCALVPAMSVGQMTQALWAVARLRLDAGEPLLKRCASKLFYGLAAARAGDLAVGLWGLARLGWVPPAGWAGVLFSQVQSLARDFRPRELVALLSALAELRLLPPPSVLGALLGEHRSAEQQLSAYSPRDLASLAHALARLSQLHATAWAQRQQRLARQQQQAQQQQQPGEAPQPAQPPQPAAAPAARPVPPPLAGAPRGLREELLHCSFHRLGAMSGRDLSTIAWALAELQLSPPPAWVYSCVAACDAALPAMSAADVALLARALQRHNAVAQLARVDAFVGRALARLGELEAAGGEYTAGRLDALLGMAAHHGAAGPLTRQRQQQREQQQQGGGGGEAAAAEAEALKAAVLGTGGDGEPGSGSGSDGDGDASGGDGDSQERGSPMSLVLDDGGGGAPAAGGTSPSGGGGGGDGDGGNAAAATNGRSASNLSSGGGAGSASGGTGDPAGPSSSQRLVGV